MFCSVLYKQTINISCLRYLSQLKLIGASYLCSSIIKVNFNVYFQLL